MFGTYIYLSIYLHDIVSISVSYIYICIHIWRYLILSRYLQYSFHIYIYIYTIVHICSIYVLFIFSLAGPTQSSWKAKFVWVARHWSSCPRVLSSVVGKWLETVKTYGKEPMKLTRIDESTSSDISYDFGYYLGAFWVWLTRTFDFLL